jgi:hypothetical protein
MNGSFATIMSQAVAVWADELGHDVTYLPFVGYEDIRKEFPADLDVLFISSYTQGAYLAYALSNYYRARGVITALGGPHARAYPEDAQLYFDYVVRLCDKELIDTILRNAEPHQDQGVLLSALHQPEFLPGVRQRWRFIRKALGKCHVLKTVAMVGSLGCPYSCSFCIDATVPYQTMPFEQIREDLLFLQGQPRPPMIIWHDPNFGVRFNEYMEIIESCVRPGSLSFMAESSLSLLSEAHLQRLRKNNWFGVLPGIESWFEYGAKSKQGKQTGLDGVKDVAAQVNRVTNYIPYVSCNFIFGLDVDEGPTPFELTKQFVDLTPAVYPRFAILCAYGHSSPLAREHMDAGRVLDVPFRFVGGGFINVELKNYEYLEFYDHLIDLAAYSFSMSRTWDRWRANARHKTRLLHLWRMLFAAMPSNRGRQAVRTRFEQDKDFAAFYRRDTYKPPAYLGESVKKGLGDWAAFLPQRVVEYFEHGEPTPNTRVFSSPPLVKLADVDPGGKPAAFMAKASLRS